MFALIRLADGSGGTVALDRLDADDLAHESFALDRPGTFAIDAAGSFEEAGSAASDTTLAATGWIVRREDGQVMWQMTPARPARGTLASVRDTLTLPVGVYDVYFASYGDPLVREPGPRDDSFRERVRAFLSQGGRAWVGDAGRWHFLMDALDDGARAARTSGLGDPEDEAPPSDSTFVWQALGVRNNAHPEALLEVTAPAQVRIRAVTEIADGVVADVPSIVRLGTTDTVWTATGPGRWAGGSLKNRIVEDVVTLEPGLYRAAFAADRSHAFSGWTANPPLVPSSWGMTLRRATPDAAVARLDPFTLDRPKIVAFECVGPDEELEATFTVPSALDVLVVAVGEIESGSRYDYAELDRMDEDGDWDEIWEMRDDLEPAGGASKNKRAVAALTLEPGQYRLTYETDGSHDCGGGYNSGGPTNPLWGVILYALDPAVDVASLGVSLTEDKPATETVSSDLTLPPAERLIARIDSVGSREDRRVRFTLDAPTEVVVVAQGEMSDESLYDYATIERPDGKEVWSMDWSNTVPGGEAYFHRRFEGPVALDAGTYVLRYRSDASRDFGGFGPSSYTLWGVHVYAPAETGSSGSPEVVEVAEVQPELIGGLEGLQRRVTYPEEARRAGAEGQVVVQFVVDERGQVVDPVVLRSADDRLSDAALEAVRDSRFTPGMQRGRPVKVRFSVPVTFRLR